MRHIGAADTKSNMTMQLQPPDDSDAVFTIADVARETGIQKDTLRVWERRYGFPVPVRDGSGDRRYSTEQLHRLRRIKRLLDAGYRPGAVVGLAVDALEERIAALSSASDSGRVARASTRSGDLPSEGGGGLSAQERMQWLDWIRSGSAEPMHQSLGQHALKHGLIHTLDHLIGPLGHSVGDAWAAGQLTVYQEHLFTECVQRFLQEAVSNADRQHPSPKRAPRVLLTTLPGEEHIMGLLMVECMLALEGCERRSLGRDTPLTDVVQAAEQWQVDAVAMTISALPVASSVWASLLQLRAALPADVAIWVGGSSPYLTRRRAVDGLVVMRSVQALGLQIQRWREQAFH